MTEREFRQHCWEFTREKLGELFWELVGGDSSPMGFPQVEIDRLADEIGGHIDRLIWLGIVTPISPEVIGGTSLDPEFKKFLGRVFQTRE